MPRKTHVGIGEISAAAGASMRPRPDAAENHQGRPRLRADRLASMRPRPDAAENPRGGGRRRGRRGRFNEAAARCRGKLPPNPPNPPPNPSFNEAAARCRGKLLVFGYNSATDRRLQ